jgi:hypothetical protein
MTGKPTSLTPPTGARLVEVLPVIAVIASAITEVTPECAQIAGACMTGAALIFNKVWLEPVADTAQDHIRIAAIPCHYPIPGYSRGPIAGNTV